MSGKIEEVTKSIQDMLVKDHGLKPDQVTKEKIIATDLRIDGDDAWEVLDKLSDQYSVNIEDVFEPHFWPEAGLIKIGKVRPISIEELASIVVSRMRGSS